MPPHTRSRTTAAAPHEPPPPPPPRAWRFICEAGRRRLLCYKYSAVDRSLLSPYLQGYWNTVVTLLPPWLAPNCVTVGGLLLVAASTCLSAVYSPRLDALLPPWVLLAHASLLFAYQTLDAVDGKQARRTHSSGPLGELCDHTCDALVASLAALSVGSTVLSGAGGRGDVLALWFVGTFPFALATWRTLHTGVMTLPPINGPTEGLFILMATHVLTFVVGQGAAWGGAPVQLLPPRWRAPPAPRAAAYAAAGVLMSLVDAVAHVAAVAGHEASSGRPRFAALRHLLPYCALFGSMTSLSWLSPANVAHTSPFLLLAAGGFPFALLMGIIILAHLTGERSSLMRSMWLAVAPLLPVLLNASWPAVVHRLRSGGSAGSTDVLTSAPVSEPLALAAAAVIGAAMYCRFAAGVADEIGALLGIRCFSLARRAA